MKTIEEKAKAYDEIIERAKTMLAAGEVMYGKENNASQLITDLIPELKESEDERVRKCLYNYFSECPNENFEFDGGVGKDAVLAWLEKQKEQKVSHLHPEDYPMTPGECIKPAWSEEDEKNMATLFEILNCYQRLYDGGVIVSAVNRREFLAGMTELSNWLKSLRPSWKPSEEQIGCFERLIAFKNPEPEDIKGCESLLEQLKKLI